MEKNTFELYAVQIWGPLYHSKILAERREATVGPCRPSGQLWVRVYLCMATRRSAKCICEKKPYLRRVYPWHPSHVSWVYPWHIFSEQMGVPLPCTLTCQLGVYCIPLQAHHRPAGCTPDTPLRSAGCTPAMHPHTGQLGVPLPPFREEFDIMFDCPGVKYLEWLRFPNRHLWTASQPLQPCNFQNWIIREEWSEHVLWYHGAVSWVWAMFFSSSTILQLEGEHFVLRLHEPM